MHKKTVTLYNVLFPIWFLLAIPVAWIVVLPANFLIDSAVLLLALKALGLPLKETYKKAILPVWLLGFLSDFIGAGFLFLGYSFHSDWMYENIVSPIASNPFDTVWGVLYALLAVALGGAAIYHFNYRLSFRRLEAEQAAKKKLSLTLALCTAPYLFLLPSEWFWRAW